MSLDTPIPPTEKLQNALSNIIPYEEVGSYQYARHTPIIDEDEVLKFDLILTEDANHPGSSEIQVPCGYNKNTGELSYDLGSFKWDSGFAKGFAAIMEEIKEEL